MGQPGHTTLLFPTHTILASSAIVLHGGARWELGMQG